MSEQWQLGKYRDFVFKSDLCTGCKLLVLAVLHHMTPTRLEAWPSWDTLMQETSMSRARFSRHLKALRSSGWLAQGSPRPGSFVNVYATPEVDIVPTKPEGCTTCTPTSSRAKNLMSGPPTPRTS